METRKDVSRKPGHQPVRGLARCLRDAPLSRSLSLAEAAVIRVNGRRRRKPATTTDLCVIHKAVASFPLLLLPFTPPLRTLHPSKASHSVLYSRINDRQLLRIRA